MHIVTAPYSASKIIHPEDSFLLCDLLRCTPSSVFSPWYRRCCPLLSNHTLPYEIEEIRETHLVDRILSSFIRSWECPIQSSRIRDVYAIRSDSTDHWQTIIDILYQLDCHLFLIFPHHTSSPCILDVYEPFEWNWITKRQPIGQHFLQGPSIIGIKNGLDVQIRCPSLPSTMIQCIAVTVVPSRDVMWYEPNTD